MTVLLLMKWYAARHKPEDESRVVFGYSWPAKLFGILTVSVFPFVVLDVTKHAFLRGALFVLEAVLIGYVLTLLTTKISLSADSLEVTSLLRHDTLRFADISDISSSEASQCYVVRSAGKKRLKISFYVSGVASLLKGIEERISNSQEQDTH